MKTLWDNFKTRKISLFYFYRVFRGNESLMEKFKEKILDKDPESRQILYQYIAEELQKGILDSEEAFDDEALAEDTSTNTAPEQSYVFGVLSLMGSWEITIQELRKPLLDFILQNLNELTVNDFLRVLNLTGNLLSQDKKTLYQPMIDRIPGILEKQRISSLQAHSIFMGLCNAHTDKRIVAKLLKLITSDFIYIKIQDIMKLLEKLDRFRIKSIRLYWRIQQFYVKKENILNLTPWQAKIVTKIFLKESYGEIGEAVRFYLITHKKKITKDSNLCELLFDCLNLPRSVFSNEFSELLLEIPKTILEVPSAFSFLYLLGCLEIANSENAQTVAEEAFINKWKELIANSDLEELGNISKVIEDLEERSSVISTCPWICENLIKNVSQREQGTGGSEAVIKIICSVYFNLVNNKDHSELYARYFQAFIQETQDTRLITRFVLIGFRDFPVSFSDEMLKKVRRKILMIQPHQCYHYETLLNMMKILVETEKSIKKEQNPENLLTLKDHKFSDRVQYLMTTKIGDYTYEELSILSQALAGMNFGSLRLREVIANRMIQTDTGDEKSGKYMLVI